MVKKEIQFIGKMVRSGRIQVCDSKIQAIVDMPEPSTKKLLKSFLNMASYYRSFIPRFAKIALPLMDLTNERQSKLLVLNENQR